MFRGFCRLGNSPTRISVDGFAFTRIGCLLYIIPDPSTVLFLSKQLFMVPRVLRQSEHDPSPRDPSETAVSGESTWLCFGARVLSLSLSDGGSWVVTNMIAG